MNQVDVYYTRFLDDFVLVGIGALDHAVLRLFDFEPMDLPVSAYLKALQENPDTLLFLVQVSIQSEFGPELTLKKLGDKLRAMLHQYDENHVVLYLLNNRAELTRDSERV